jgi:tricorn protease
VDLGRREDLNRVLSDMLAELGVGHARAGGGDVWRGTEEAVGLLGADLVVERGRYRIARLLQPGAWRTALRSPLREAGASEGSWLLAIDGVPLDGHENLHQRLRGSAGRSLRLTLAGDAEGGGRREVELVPLADERELRYADWVERNRRVVDAASAGRIGYLHVPDTGRNGLRAFRRQWPAQLERAALIVDARGNRGGRAPDSIIDSLARRPLGAWRGRDGIAVRTPHASAPGPKLMLIDQDSGSGGDMLPYAFRALGLGPLFGTRTWGGTIAVAAQPRLVDGGYVDVPAVRFIDVSGHASIENRGVAPDVRVPLDPLAAEQGRDSQLEAALGHLLEAFDHPR